MGWWRKDNGDALGDGPADRISGGLDELNKVLGRKLRLSELLGALGTILLAKSGDLLAPGEVVVGPFVADLDVDGDASRVDAELSIEQRIRDSIDGLCARITDEYEMALERRPTLSEMLASYCFALGYRAERRLDLPELAGVRRIQGLPK